MQVISNRRETSNAIRNDLGAIFVSMELSRSTWLITSLSPGGGEKMSKHTLPAGDIGALLARFSELGQKALTRNERSFPIIVIQEAGLDGFWIHRVMENEGIESHVVDPASIATSRRPRRAKTDRIDGEALLRALLAYKRGEPRVCAMVKAPAPEEEDRRRLCRERKVLTNERVLHVNRIKGLLFSQGVAGYEPLRRDRRQRTRGVENGRWPSVAAASQGSDQPRTRSTGTLARADQVRGERKGRAFGRTTNRYAKTRGDVARHQGRRPRVRPPFSGQKVCADTSTIAAKSLPMRDWRRRRGRVVQLIANRACPRRVTHDCGQRSFSLLGSGCVISRNRRWLFGSKSESIATAVVSRKRPSWRWRASCWSRFGNL